MNQLKFYKYATWGLLLLNVAVLTFFLLTKPKPPHHPAPANFQQEVVEVLNLSSEQEATFRELAKDHNQKMKSINARQQELLLPYFQSLANPAMHVDESEVLSQIQQLEKEKLEVTRQHFQDLKAILHDDQLPYFKDFLSRFISNVLGGNKKKSPLPEGFR